MHPAPSSSEAAISLRRARLGWWLGVITDMCVGLVVVVTPAIMATKFELSELYKQAWLVGLSAIALTAWQVKMIVTRRVEVVMGWVHVPLFLLGLATLLSAIFSIDRYGSFLGQFSQRAWSFASIAALVALAWLISQRVRTAVQAYQTACLVLLSCVAVSLVGAWAIWQKLAWNPTGSAYALTVVLAAALVFSVGLLIYGTHQRGSVFALSAWPGVLARAYAWLVMIVSGGLLLVINFWLGWMGVAVGMFGLLVSCWLDRSPRRTSLPWALPGAWLIIAVLLLLSPSLWTWPLPGEVALSSKASWGIAQQVLVDSPALGTGPGTWTYDYVQHRERVLNISPFWATRFDRATSQILTLLATTGLVGLLVFLGSVVAIAFVSLRAFLSSSRSDHEDEIRAMSVFLCPWLALAVSLAVYNFNLSHQVLFWTLSGALIGLTTRTVWKLHGASGAWWPLITTKAVVMAVICLAVLVLGGQAVWAEATLLRVLGGYQAGTITAPTIITQLEAARRVHPWHDLSARVLSQAYLVRIVSAIQDKPIGERARAVADETAKMVDLALLATRLNAVEPDNWSNAAMAYSNIASFTREADAFALKNYTAARQRDPQNPVYPSEMGKVHLVRAEQARDKIEAADRSQRLAAIKQSEEALQEAAKLFRQALNLKSDYAPALYHLAVALEKQGKTQEAVVFLEQVVAQDAQPERLFELGVLYARLRQREAATVAFERVIALDAKHAKAHWQLVLLYEQAGRFNDALREARAVFVLQPNNPEAQKKLKTLETL